MTQEEAHRDTKEEQTLEECVCAQCGTPITDYDGVSMCCGELPSAAETVQRCPAVFCPHCSTVAPASVCPVCHTSRTPPVEPPPAKRQACSCDEDGDAVSDPPKEPDTPPLMTKTATATTPQVCKCSGAEYGLCEWQGREEERGGHEGKCQGARVAAVVRALGARAAATERELRGEVAALRDALAAEKRRQQLLHATWTAQVQARLDGVRTQLAAEVAAVRAAGDAAAARLLAAHAQVRDEVAAARREHTDALRGVQDDVARARDALAAAQTAGAQQQRDALEGARDEMARQVLRRLECSVADVERRAADAAAEQTRLVEQTAAALRAETRAAVETAVKHATEVDQRYAEVLQCLEQAVRDVARLESAVTAERAAQASLEATVENIRQESVPHVQQHCGALTRAVELLDRQRAYLERAAAERAGDCKVLTLHSSIATATTLKLSSQRLHIVPPVLSGCHALCQLSLENNKLTDLPNWFGHLSTLQVLHLDNNRLTHLSPSIADLHALRELTLSGNNLSAPDAFPPALGQLSCLELVSLSACKLCTVPSFLLQPSVAASIRWLLLDDNALDIPELPGPLQKAPRICALFLGGSNPCAPTIVGTSLANGTIIGSQLQHSQNVSLADALHALDTQHTLSLHTPNTQHHLPPNGFFTPLKH